MRRMMLRSVFTSAWVSSVSPTSGRSDRSLVAGSISFSCNAFSTPLEPPGGDKILGRMRGWPVISSPDRKTVGPAPPLVQLRRRSLTRGRNAPRHHSRGEWTTPRGGLWRRVYPCRDPLQRRNGRDFHRGRFRDAPRGASAIRYSQYSSPPVHRSQPQRRGGPRIFVLQHRPDLKEISAPRLACGFGAFIPDADRCLKTAHPLFPDGTPE